MNDGRVNVPASDIYKLADKGTLIIDVGDAESVDVELSAEQIRTLLDKDATVLVRNDDVEMNMPLSNLPKGKDITIGLTLSDDADDAVSNIYDLTVDADGEAIDTFETPVQLTFNVDMDKVDKTDDLEVYYFNGDKDEWVLVPDSVFEDDKVNVEVDHFTKFGVFEKVEEDDDDEKDPEKEDPKGDGDDDNGDKCDCDDNNGDNGNGVGTNDGDNGDGDNNGKKQNGHVSKYDGSGTKGTDSSDKLPSTATSIYNFMLLGAAFLLAGSLAFFIYRRKNKKETT